MNGRMYDTDLRRFLSPDNYVQDPSNTQNYNRYQYGYNNPLKYSDPSGEFFFLAAVILGAIVGAASYAVNAAITGKWSWGGFFKAIVMGGVSGAISFGIGSWTASMKGILSTVVNISAHAVASGAQSLVQGGKFLSGALAGGISAGIAKGVSALTSAAKRMSTFVKSAITTAAGGVSGGIGSVLGGGKFIDGFRQGVITAGLNHAAHKIAGKMYENRARKARVRQAWMKRMYQGNGGMGDPPKYKLLALAWLHSQIGGGKPLTIDASTLDFSGLSQSDLSPADTPGYYTVNLFNKMPLSDEGLTFGTITLKALGNNRFNILPDDYDFDIKWSQGFSMRNIATFGAGLLHGQLINNYYSPLSTPYLLGGPFRFYFKNSVYIKP